MVSKFLLNTFLSNSLYLGYTKNFRHASMLFDIKAEGVNKIELHNISHTVSNLRKLLLITSSIWAKYGNIWFVLSKLGPAVEYSRWFLQKNADYFLLNDRIATITFWDKNWISGLLTNKHVFRAKRIVKPLPIAVYFFNYTFNRSHFNEANNLQLLQAGLADTNSDSIRYQYLVNANEKSSSSYLFVLKLILSASFAHMKYSYKEFLIPSVSE